MNQYRIHTNRNYGSKPTYIYGNTIEEAVENHKGIVASASYENVVRGDINIISITYSAGILGGKGGHVVTFEFEQGSPTNGRRIGTSWLYTDRDGNPAETDVIGKRALL